jgi:general stress protein 26
MEKIPDEVRRFLQEQGFVVVSTIDRNGFPHTACKDIVQISDDGEIYLLDLYKGVTFNNLVRDPHLSLTAVDEHKFKGFCLKGKAKIIEPGKVNPEIISVWENRITNRVSQRIVKNIKGEKGHASHPEVLLPKPEYMLVVKVSAVIDLTPHHLK